MTHRGNTAPDRDQPPWVVATYDRILRRSIMQRSRYAVVRMVLGVPVLVQPDEECQRRMMMVRVLNGCREFASCL